MTNACGILSLLLFLWSCSSTSDQKVTLFSGTEMTINYRILIGRSLPSEEQIVVSKIIKAVFNEVDQIYNKWNPQSELSKLNQLKSGVQIQISPDLEKLLLLTDKITRVTAGRFDPTIEPLQALWKKYLSLGLIPPEKEIESLKEVIGWNKIHFDKGFFYKDHDLTSLDLGGIAKGYCVDLLVTRLNQAGYNHVYVEWGGEIRASGQHPDHRPWNIFISRLENTNPDEAIAFLSLKDQAIATSGDYLQNWTVKGEGDEKITYFHIIDPVSLHPLICTSESIASASVVASSCALADGLATAAMMFPNIHEAKEWAEEIKKQFPELSFWIISRNQGIDSLSSSSNKER